MHGKTIVVGVCGGIAAYKAAEICSSLGKKGFDVHVIMTRSATQFIQPLTFQALTHNPVITDIFHEPDPSSIAHIRLADVADLMVIAPATADVIGKIANGIADDMLTTTVMATTAQVLFAPAMNVHMYANPIVQDQIQYLKSKGYLFMEPGEGPLACGYTGRGRLPEPADIVNQIDTYIRQAQPSKDFTGAHVLVTAGSTRETIDPVRFVSNRATGKMGIAIADMAKKRGANVTLVLGPTNIQPPTGVSVIRVESAQDMYDAVMKHAQSHDIIIKSAAVADYRPVVTHTQKVKKQPGHLVIEFERTPDILQTLGEHKQPNQVLVGFAAETEHVEQYAMDKLSKKNLDLVVANDVSLPDRGFAVDTNAVQVFNKNGLQEATDTLSKQEIANRILDHIAVIWREKHHG